MKFFKNANQANENIISKPSDYRGGKRENEAPTSLNLYF